MPPKKTTTTAPPPQLPSYHSEIQRPLNQLLLIVPLLLFFQIGSARLGSDLLVPEYLRIVLLWFGATGKYLSAIFIVAVLVIQHFVRHDPNKPSPWVALGMVVESAIWILPLLAANWITSRIPPAAEIVTDPATASYPLLRSCLEAIGAGVYEEFLFRLIFITLIILICVDLFHLPKLPSVIGAIIVSAVLFSLCHFSGAQVTGSEALPWDSVSFLFIAGAWWGVLFVWRGYAVATCTHIWWNILVIAIQ